MGWGTFFAGVWAVLQKLGPTLKEGATLGFGMLLEMLRAALANEKRLKEQLQEVLDEERRAAKRGVNGAAGRLRNSGYTKPKP